MSILVAIITIVMVLAFCGIIAWVVIKKVKAQAYSVVIVSKGTNEIESREDNSSTSYFLRVKLEDGRHFKIRVGWKIWKQMRQCVDI